MTRQPAKFNTGQRQVQMLLLILTVSWLSLSGYALAEVKNTAGDQLQSLIEQGIPVIDVRREDEWRKTGVLENSHMLTFFDKSGRYNVDKWLAELAKIVAPDQPMILICAVGGRTSTISSFLDSKLGFKNVYNVRGGITDWIKQKRPVVSWPLAAQ